MSNLDIVKQEELDWCETHQQSDLENHWTGLWVKLQGRNVVKSVVIYAWSAEMMNNLLNDMSYLKKNEVGFHQIVVIFWNKLPTSSTSI